MFDTPPPRTIAAGSNTLMIDASPRASRRSYLETDSRASASPVPAAATIAVASSWRPVLLRGLAPGPVRRETFRYIPCGRSSRAGRPFVGLRPRQRVVAPLPRDRVGARHHATVHHKPAANARAEDHAEHYGQARRRAVGGFRQREAIGIVREPHRTAEPRGQILRQRTAVQPCRVGVLDEARGGRNHARHADPDSRVADDEFGVPRRATRRPRSSHRSCRAAWGHGDEIARARRRRAQSPRSSFHRDLCRCAPEIGPEV